MDSKHVTVVYKWTARPGKLEELAAIYADVTAAMEANEPGAETVHIYISEQDNALYVRDEFEDAAAMGFHLSTTAAAHFPQLLANATPGPFFFMVDVPAEMKAATEQMQLGGEIATHSAGFDRSPRSSAAEWVHDRPLRTITDRRASPWQPAHRRRSLAGGARGGGTLRATDRRPGPAALQARARGAATRRPCGHRARLGR